MRGVPHKRLNDLHDPFPLEDIEWRIGRTYYDAKKNFLMAWALCYITSRALHRRLDEVCGPHCWQSHGYEWKDGAITEISILVEGEDGTSDWITKYGGADPTQMEGFKGMLSGSEKRAGVPWGIGRYLYDLPETRVDVSFEKVEGWRRGTKKRKTGADLVFWWEEPELPEWAKPFSESMDLNQTVKDMKSHVSSEEEWKALNRELRTLYRSNDVNYIVRTHGRDILNKLENKGLRFQKGD